MDINNKAEINVGIDTGKKTLDIYIDPHGEHFIVDNSSAGVKEAIRRIKPHKPKRVVIESTGRLEMLFACKAYEAGLPVIIANPMKVHKFASAIGQLAKSDKLDAKTIARFGEAVKPRLTDIKPKNMRLISDLLVRRSQLLDMSTMEKNRLTIMPKELHSSIKRHLKFIQKDIASIEDRLDKLIDETPQWKETRDILLSVNGVGKVMAYTLLSELPELGQLNRKEIASLVGLAPMNRESGTFKGTRKIRGGRYRIRTVMFMAMMSTIQSNTKFRGVYQRMVSAGKPKKVAIIACMRRMLTTLNTMVKNGTQWNEKLA